MRMKMLSTVKNGGINLRLYTSRPRQRGKEEGGGEVCVIQRLLKSTSKLTDNVDSIAVILMYCECWAYPTICTYVNAYSVRAIETNRGGLYAGRSILGGTT